MDTSSNFRKTLNVVRKQIFDSIRPLMKKLGGKVCFRMYHDYSIIGFRYAFFDVDIHGYGRVLFLDTAEQTPDGSITITFHDTEDCSEPMWDLMDLAIDDALNMLDELEQIVDFHTEHPGKPVLTKYDADFDYENY